MSFSPVAFDGYGGEPSVASAALFNGGPRRFLRDD